MDDKERLLHFRQHKSQVDQTERHGNEWNSFLKDRQRDVERYGDTRADLLNRARQEELESKFLEENKGLEAQHQLQWDKFHETGIPEKGTEMSETRIPSKEKVSDSFENSRRDMLGQKVETIKEKVRGMDNPVEKTTNVYENLMNQHGKSQKHALKLENKVSEQGIFDGRKIEQLTYDHHDGKENAPIPNTIGKMGFGSDTKREELKEKIADYTKTTQLQHQLNPMVQMTYQDKQNSLNQQNPKVSQNEQERKRAEKVAERLNAFNELKAKEQKEAERTEDRDRT